MVCGKYRIESVVGAGGMGVVMGATDTSLNRPVAIKFLSPDRAARDGAVARFLREARAAASIQSEHVVRVFDVSTLPNGAPFIVMEHLRGGDLAQLLATRGALPIDEAADYVLQSCEALGEAHGRGIVHRDLKPQNLFLTQRPDGSSSIKVLDFGISKAIEEGGQNLTATDTVMGTPLYMSPEQVRSLKNVDARADIWALGSILFELLTMAPIFQAPSASALCAMIAMDQPTPLRALRPQAPPELEAVILRCLHKDPAGRFQDVAALADALAPFASERGRLSATRVSAVVRRGSAAGGPPYRNESGGTVPTPFGSGPAAPAMAPYPVGGVVGGMHSTSGTGPTMGDASGPATRFSGAPAPSVSHPPMGGSGPAGFGPSQPPPGVHQHPTTQSTWHQTQSGTTHATPPGKRGSGVIIAMLGVLTGLLLLGLIGGGAYVYVGRKDAAAAAAAASAADAGRPGAVASTAPIPTLTTTTTATTTPTDGKTTPIAPKAKDAGAPSSQKDAGAAPGPSPAPTPTPTPTPDRDKEEAERNAALGRQAEANCKVHQQNMTTFARDEASRKQAAERAKMFTCKGQSSSKCERQVCLQACMVLNDQMCIQQINYVINHGQPAKY